MPIETLTATATKPAGAVLSSAEWNQLTQNTRYFLNSGYLACSASSVQNEVGPSGILPPVPNQVEHFYSVDIRPGYVSGVFRIRFNLTGLFLPAPPFTAFSEELVVRIYRKGAVQKIAHFYIPGNANVVSDGNPVSAFNPLDVYIVFDLLPEIWADIGTIDRGYISLQRVCPDPAPQQLVNHSSGVYSAALQLFTPCQ